MRISDGSRRNSEEQDGVSASLGIRRELFDKIGSDRLWREVEGKLAVARTDGGDALGNMSLMFKLDDSAARPV